MGVKDGRTTVRSDDPRVEFTAGARPTNLIA